MLKDSLRIAQRKNVCKRHEAVFNRTMRWNALVSDFRARSDGPTHPEASILIQAEANPDARSSTGTTALNEAVRRHREGAATVLVTCAAIQQQD